ncbi:Protein roadkill [Araneus ventricosus]|uniref:Protein roadkill n=1 Tax=Araneus ventricosus TaxID=182803 RepID=A0A4Y2IA92_ARAVE|nr:Protein roadkill [Araneus ventricosus]
MGRETAPFWGRIRESLGEATPAGLALGSTVYPVERLKQFLHQAINREPNQQLTDRNLFVLKGFNQFRQLGKRPQQQNLKREGCKPSCRAEDFRFVLAWPSCEVILIMMQVDNTTDDTHIIEWRIVNFSNCVLAEGEKLECPISAAGNLYNTHWVLWIYPKGKKENPNFLGCFLRRGDKEKVGPETLHVEFEFSLVAFDGVKTFKKQACEEFKRKVCYGFPEYVKLEEIFCRKEFLLQSDTLTLRCKLRLLAPKTKQTSHQIFMTKFPTEKVSTYLTLDNFRGISKQNPRVLNIGGSNDLLSLKVSMNKDETFEDKVPEKPGTSESFLHIVMMKKKAKAPIRVSCWIKLVSKKLEIAIDKEISHLFSKVDKKEEWVLPYFIDTNKLGDDCIENDALYLDFDFTICDSRPLSLQTADLTPPKLRTDPKETTLMRDLVDLHRTKEFSDVTLRVGGEALPAHKSILAARSPRFEEIFTRLRKKKMKCENHIEEIGDVDENTMALMLKFIYTDQLEDMDDERCLSLYSAAQKYRISSLQCKCAKVLRTNLSVKAVYKVLLIAEEFKDSDMKMVALDFILEHYQHVLLTPEWQAFTEEHEELANQVMRHIRLKKQQQLED